MFTKKLSLILSLSLVLLLPCLAMSAAMVAGEDTGDEAERARMAANVLREIMKVPESSIPQELLEGAQGIAVVPNLVKAAFGIGGKHGKGLVSRRTSKGTWSVPAFIDISGGSFGFQIGVTSTDLILVFMNEDGLKGLLEDKLELGAGASVAAGPVGRTVGAGTNVTLDSAIYTYSRSKGLFAGVSLKGSVMTIDDSANHDVYGPKVSGKDILRRKEVAVTPVVKPFVEALQKYSPKLK